MHKQPPYNKHGPVSISNEEDGIYAGLSTDNLVQTSSGKHLILNLIKDQQGEYIGTFNILVNASQIWQWITSSIFSEKEKEYLKSQHIARIVTVIQLSEGSVQSSVNMQSNLYWYSW